MDGKVVMTTGGQVGPLTKITGKRILVMGGAGGIGTELVKLLVYAGAQTCVVDKKYGKVPGVISYLTDVTMPNSITEVLESVHGRDEGIYLLVNALGIKSASMTEDYEVNGMIPSLANIWMMKNTGGGIVELSSDIIFRALGDSEKAKEVFDEHIYGKSYFLSKYENLQNLLALGASGTKNPVKYAFLGPVHTPLLFDMVDDPTKRARLEAIADSPVFVAEKIMALILGDYQRLVYKSRLNYVLE